MELSQLTFFPEASSGDIEQTRFSLVKFAKAKADIEGFEAKNPDCHNKKLEEAKHIKDKIENAVSLIIDDDVRRVIEFRFLKGNLRKATVQRFGAIMSESTVDRCIEKGIVSVAETLKLWRDFES